MSPDIKRNLLLYSLLVGFFGCVTWLIILAGQDLHPRNTRVLPVAESISSHPPTMPAAGLTGHFFQNLKDPLSLLLLQIMTIIFFCRLFGGLTARIGQPPVVGEMIAGIVLGPSVLGLIFPGFSALLFPKASLGNLQFLSQIGMIFFMFIIGMEVNIDKLKNKAHNAVVISHASIVFPYCLGVAAAYFLYEPFAPANANFTAFALFIGIAVSITAFPVLARILQERGISRTPLGAIALTCAAFDDVTGWCILAAVVAIVKAGNISSALFTILFSALFILIMMFGVRPMLKKITGNNTISPLLNKKTVIIIFLVLLFSAFTSEMIGIHALFGAFLAGVIMPKDIEIRKLLTEKVEDVSLLMLLPLFFALTGLRTEIGLLNEGGLWLTFLLVLLVAVLGKFGGSAGAAKLTGQSWTDAFSIGALMNTRGLMELIVLNIGYDLGILSPSLFAIFVLMALATTFMTGPLLDAIDFVSRKRASASNKNLHTTAE